jgi:hypothetical protein
MHPCFSFFHQIYSISICIVCLSSYNILCPYTHNTHESTKNLTNNNLTILLVFLTEVSIVTTRVYRGELRWESNDREWKQRVNENFDIVTFLATPVGTRTLLCIFSGEPVFCERFWMIIRERVWVDIYFISWGFPDVSVLTFSGEKHLNSSLLPLHVRHLPRHRHTPSVCLARPCHRPSHHSNWSISCHPISQAPICPHS